MTRRGTRIVTGYVVSLSGKKGGPWLMQHGSPGTRYRTDDKFGAKEQQDFARRNSHPSARVLPVVRYELDREEERLRDAVVEAALAYEAEVEPGKAGSLYAGLQQATRALRAHLEKKR